jgi:hypothetical protein
MLFIGAVMQLPILGFPASFGPSPPGPSSTGVFTVSGGWVNLTFPEFFFGVSYTDAPICKRTN